MKKMTPEAKKALGLAIIWTVAIVLSAYVGIVIKHYWHSIQPLVIGLFVLFTICFYLKNKTNTNENTLKCVKWLGLIVVLFGYTHFSLRMPTTTGYLGDSPVTIYNKDSVYQYDFTESYDRAMESDSVVFLNPNCNVCQAVVPTVKEKLKGTDTVYVDVTRKASRKITHSVGVEKVPFAYAPSEELRLRLGYESDSGIKFFDDNIDEIVSVAKEASSE